MLTKKGAHRHYAHIGFCSNSSALINHTVLRRFLNPFREAQHSESSSVLSPWSERGPHSVHL